jgi:peptidoglycan/xylan/chitin deacetylase (PgdA/CDA1 family)
LGADHVGPLAADRPNVAVTFDDAFRSIRENALPALERHGVPATIFAPSGYLGRAPGWAMETSHDRDETVMSADELAALPRELIAIGSHTVLHPHLTQLAESEVREELCASRASLEALLGRTVDTLAFPYGDHDGRVVELARTAGYRFVYTVAPQAIAAADASISRGRTSADPADSPSLFALKSRGAFDWMPMASRLKAALRLRS